LRTFEGHKKTVHSVNLSADNRFVLSSSADNTLKLWELATGRCLISFFRDSERLLCLSADWQFILVSHWEQAHIRQKDVARLWKLDWELEEKTLADWDEGARPYLENFLTLHTPYAAILPADREPSDEEITLALSRGGTPTWTEKDFQNLLYTLGCGGYGWLSSEGVKQQLSAMVKEIEPLTAEQQESKEKQIYGENSDRVSEISSRLLKERIIFLGTAIDDDIANDIIVQLLFLDAEDSEKDIQLYINSPGGSVSAGISIYETMQQIQPDVVTICVGLAAGIAAVLLSAGASGKRMSLPDGRVMISKPVGGSQEADIENQATETAYLRHKLAETLAIHTGQLVEKISKDTESDYFMSSLEAKEYGIIDTVLDRSQLPSN